MVDFDLQTEVREYVAGHFSPEKQTELYLCLDLFAAFGYAGIWPALTDVLFDLTRDDADLTEQSFLATIDQHLDKLFEAHQIELTDDAELTIKNQLLSALYRIQHAEDPTPFLRLLETDLENEEKLARIVEQLSILDTTLVLTTVASIADSSLKAMEAFLIQLEERRGTAEIEKTATKELLENLRDFFNYHGRDNLANELIVNDLPVGIPVRDYYPYVAEHLFGPTDEQSALNLLGLFCLAEDTYRDPLQAFRQYSEALIPSLEKRVKIEQVIGKLVTDLRQYQGAKRDATSVSVVQHPA